MNHFIKKHKILFSITNIVQLLVFFITIIVMFCTTLDTTVEFSTQLITLITTFLVLFFISETFPERIYSEFNEQLFSINRKKRKFRFITLLISSTFLVPFVLNVIFLFLLFSEGKLKSTLLIEDTILYLVFFSWVICSIVTQIANRNVYAYKTLQIVIKKNTLHIHLNKKLNFIIVKYFKENLISQKKPAVKYIDEVNSDICKLINSKHISNFQVNEISMKSHLLNKNKALKLKSLIEKGSDWTMDFEPLNPTRFQRISLLKTHVLMIICLGRYIPYRTGYTVTLNKSRVSEEKHAAA